MISLDTRERLKPEQIAFAIAQLRHLYVNLLREAKGEIADGLLSPQIEILERWQREHLAHVEALERERDELRQELNARNAASRAEMDHEGEVAQQTARAEAAEAQLSSMTREKEAREAEIARLRFKYERCPRFTALDIGEYDRCALLEGHDGPHTFEEPQL